MTDRRRDAASERQVEAADPRASTWLSANAGSGKTRVLTDRVARLLLDGAPPENILCLTYTTAAASEMQNRLFKRLGEWAMLGDAPLTAALRSLGVEAALDADLLARARRLFARAIEAPGGLKIQTIHSFCAGILRRYPLEAGLTPGFAEMDEAMTADLLTSVLNTVATEAPEDYAAMAALVSDPDLSLLCKELSKHRTALPATADPALALGLHGLPPDFREDDILPGIMEGLSAIVLEQIAKALGGQSRTMQDLAADLRVVAQCGVTEDSFGLLRARCLYAASNKENANRPKPSALTKKAREALGGLADDFDLLAARVARAVDQHAALAASKRTLALHRFAARFLPAYAAAKAERGGLDFDDLIERTEHLLSRPGISDWVLYRLDGSLDHILVDEAQDTSPLQWRVIGHLTREMTTGSGTSKPGEKTLFVVGDLKQSIYSFQGADPAGFSRMRDDFDARLRHTGPGLNKLDLEYSFRSAAPILTAVDLTYPEDRPPGMGDRVLHRAFRAEMPGRVDLWPDIPATVKADEGHWTDPVGAVSEEHHHAVMARRVAAEIRRLIDDEVLWDGDERQGYRARRIIEGDVLILVQSRGALFHQIITACKSAGLRVAGADVLRLGEDLAVKDLLACLSFLATPEDDLSLAAVLRSPLIGMSEDTLFRLAATRPERAYLWATLRDRADHHPETFARLNRLRDVADYLRPYDLLERILIREQGRQRLIGRLGEEAADGIDALLSAALTYEQEDVPSLTGFLARMQGNQISVKRRSEGRGDKLRVMTVHGAKGLESPIVVLPDTGVMQRRGRVDDALIPTDDGTPLYRPPASELHEEASRLKTAIGIRRKEEGQRLLYVAMTRAEQWLIVGAAGNLGKQGDTWRDQIAAALDRSDAVDHDFGFGTGKRLQSPQWTASPTVTAAPTEPDPTIPTALPDWALTVPAAPDRPAQTLSPSDLGGAKALPGELAAFEKGDALARGTALHLLLEHLPRIAIPDRYAVARRLLPEWPEPEELLSEATTVLGAPALAEIFSPDTLAEVPVTAALEQLAGRRIFGTIDRLIVSEDRVMAIDFKSNAVVPAHPQDVPEGLLRQMGAYAAALAQIYPDRQVETAILWTRTATLMLLPAALTGAALSRADAMAADAHEPVMPVTPP